MSDDWPDFPVILGFGSMHSVREEGEPAPRLAGLRSVSPAAALALARRPDASRNPIGFHRPRKA